MKNLKKVIAIVLAAIMVMMTMAVPAFAGDDDLDPSVDASSKFKSVLYSIIDKIISFALKILNVIIPGRDWGKNWPKTEEYSSGDGFSAGDATFTDTVSENAVWSMGYAKASLLTGLDVMDGTYFMGGSLEPLNGRTPERVVDDQQVVVYAISDGSGIVVHAVIDCFGLPRGEVVKIRQDLAEWASENNVTSIQVSALHQHSCIDTLGLSAPLVRALLFNSAYSVVNADISKYVQGVNPNFMANLYKYTEECIKSAVAGMTEGTLSFGSIDASELIYDKRTPDNTQDDIFRLRFVPYDNSDEIWVVNINAHDVSFGASATELSGDYPYYVREYLAAKGIRCAYVQGAELAITSDGDGVENWASYTTDEERAKAMGKAFAEKLLAITEETVLEPTLNIASKEVKITADNGVLILAVREGLINETVATDGSDLVMVTEIGYMELGGKVGVFFAPGELDPQIVWGTATGDVLTSEQTWTGATWDKTPIAEITDVDTLLCFGLANDQIGYVLCSSDYRSILTENEEILAASHETAENLVDAFAALYAEVK